MFHSRMTLSIIVLHIFAATIFLVLIPPWQAADEPTHFEQILIFSEPHRKNIDTMVRRSEIIEKQLLISMDEYTFWDHVGYSRTNPLPETFDRAPFISIVASQWTKPPFYYIFCAFILKWLPSNDIITFLYILRFISLFLSCLIMVQADGISILLNLTFRQRGMILLFLALLPQFNVLSVTVNTDIFLLLFYFLFFKALFQLNIAAVQLPVLVKIGVSSLCCILSERVGLVTVPIFLLYICLQLQQKQFVFLLKISLYGLFMAILSSPLVSFFFPTIFFKVIDRLSIFYLGMTLTNVTLSGIQQSLLHFLEVLFSSAICSFGWMKYGLPSNIFHIILTLFFILVISRFLIGFINKGEKKKSRETRNYAKITFLATTILFIFLLIYLYWLKGFFGQGRFLFPLLWYGAYHFSGAALLEKLDSPVISYLVIVIVHLVYFFIYIYSLFFVCIPAFYF